MTKEITFNLFRYQILPKERIQFTLFDNIKSVEELIEKKNMIFKDIILSLESSKEKHRRLPIKFQLKFNKDEFLIFKLGILKTTKIGNENLEDMEQDDWKYIFIIFWNNPNKQFFLIQDKNIVFNDTATSKKLITTIINKFLLDKQLVFRCESLFDKSEFWNLVKEYKQSITKVKFNLVTPNMAQISSTLSEDLKNLSKSTNAVDSSLEINSSEQSTLSLNENNKSICSLVDYASSGGGSIQLKVKGVRKQFSTNGKNKSISIDEIKLTGLDESSLSNGANVIKDMLKDL